MGACREVRARRGRRWPCLVRGRAPGVRVRGAWRDGGGGGGGRAGA